MWILYLLIGIFVIALLRALNANKADAASFKEAGIDPAKFIDAGKYLSGHVAIDDPREHCWIYPTPEAIKIYAHNKSTLRKDHLSDIAVADIKDISLEDETTIKTRVGLKRMLALGVFAFAIKKKEKLELAYLIIEWGDGHFNHETVFEFEGSNSVAKANHLRNKLIRGISKDTTAEDNLNDEIRALKRQGKMVTATKLYYDEKKVTLKEAKEYVERIDI